MTLRIKPKLGKTPKPSAQIHPPVPDKPSTIYPRASGAEVDVRDVRIERAQGSKPPLEPKPVEGPQPPLPASPSPRSQTPPEEVLPSPKQGTPDEGIDGNPSTPKPLPASRGLGWDSIGNGDSAAALGVKVDSKPSVAWFPDPALRVPPQSDPEVKQKVRGTPSRAEQNSDIGFDSFGTDQAIPKPKPEVTSSAEDLQQDLGSTGNRTSKSGDALEVANEKPPTSPADQASAEPSEIVGQSATPGVEPRSSTSPDAQSHQTELDPLTETLESTKPPTVRPDVETPPTAYVETPATLVDGPGKSASKRLPGGPVTDIAPEQTSFQAGAASSDTPTDGPVIHASQVRAGLASRGVKKRKAGNVPTPYGGHKSESRGKPAKQKSSKSKVPIGYQARLAPEPDADASTWVMVEGFRITAEFHEYLLATELFTNNKFGSEQKKLLLEDATTKPFLLLDEATLKAHAGEFDPIKTKLIAEWEEHTKRKWPRYAEDVLDKKGGLYRKKGDLFDAHHILPKRYKGPHKWYNLTPARSPGEHQGGIHKTKIFKSVFK